MRYDLYQTEREKAEILPNGLKVLKYQFNDSKKYCLKMWKPKALKPYFNYSFNSEETRQDYINKQIASFNSHQLDKKQRRFEERIDITQIDLKRGDVFYTSWGYDQTNYDYIVILSIKGQFAICQRTSSLHMGNSGQCNVQEPIFCPFGDTFRMKIKKDRESFYLRGSYPYCHDGKFDGGRGRLDSFYKHKEGSQYHETMAAFGH